MIKLTILEILKLLRLPNFFNSLSLLIFKQAKNNDNDINIPKTIVIGINCFSFRIIKAKFNTRINKAINPKAAVHLIYFLIGFILCLFVERFDTYLS